jgi:septum formation protein
MTQPRFVLASGSPRRAALLHDAGYRFDVAAPDVDERPLPGESAAAMVERVAAVKANAVGDLDAVVLGVDTIVVLDGEVLGKPGDEEEAIATLLRLGGRSHVVLSGWAVLAGERVASGIERTVVTMHTVDRTAAESYAASGEPLDRAGAYAIQGEGRRFVAGWEGSYNNVVGLPIEVLVPVLARFGVTPASPR